MGYMNPIQFLFINIWFQATLLLSLSLVVSPSISLQVSIKASFLIHITYTDDKSGLFSFTRFLHKKHIYKKREAKFRRKLGAGVKNLCVRHPNPRLTLTLE